MPKNKKIKRGKAAQTGPSAIKAQPVPHPGISFSFKYYQADHEKFCCSDREISYWTTFLERLKALSGISAQEMMRNRSPALRCHPIDWETTSEVGFGLPNEEQLVDTPYQFSLSSNAHGRVHGFFIDKVFYIVWLDPEHLLYPSQR